MTQHEGNLTRSANGMRKRQGKKEKENRHVERFKKKEKGWGGAEGGGEKMVFNKKK